MSHNIAALRYAVEQDGDDLTSDEATALFVALDAARDRIAALEGDVQRLEARVLHLHLYARHAVGFLNEALDGH